MKRLFALAILLAWALAASPVPAQTSSWTGRWIGGQQPNVRGPLLELSKRCDVNFWSEAIVDFETQPDGKVEGTLIRVFMATALGVQPPRPMPMSEAVQLCKLPGTRQPLDGARVESMTFIGKKDGERLRVVVTARNCEADKYDWCDGVPGSTRFPDTFTLHQTPQGTVVIDDGNLAAMDDDYYHLWTEERYKRRLGDAQAMADKYFAAFFRSNWAQIKSMYARYTATDAQMQDYRNNLVSRLGGVPTASTIAQRLMTFPDPSDPVDYMTLIVRLSGPNAYSNMFLYISGNGPSVKVLNSVMRSY